MPQRQEKMGQVVRLHLRVVAIHSRLIRLGHDARIVAEAVDLLDSFGTSPDTQHILLFADPEKDTNQLESPN